MPGEMVFIILQLDMEGHSGDLYLLNDTRGGTQANKEMSLETLS